jgi:hypothetical protein
MIDEPEMRSLLQSMESAAEEVLQNDPAFFENLSALQSEIERNPRVQSALKELRRSGQNMIPSFVPRVNIRVRTENGVLSLPSPGQVTNPDRQSHALAEELRTAVAEVIQNSGRFRELHLIVNEATGSSDVFDGIASRIEQEGYEIIICLDFSACTRVPSNILPPRVFHQPRRPSERSPSLSMTDRKFLSTIGIRADF